MTAVLEHLVARHVLEPENDQWQLATPLAMVEVGMPETLRHLVETLVARLPPPAQRALEAGSFAGVVFPSWVVAALRETSIDEAEHDCEWLVQHTSLLRRTAPIDTPEATFSRYEFVHALYRDVLYHRQAPRRRVLGHRAIAERLETLYGDQAEACAAELAWHWEEGHELARAVRYLRIVADRAVARYAHCEAVSMLRHALELTTNGPPPEQHTADILERIGTLSLLQGEAIASAEAFEQLEQVGRERQSVELQLLALRHAMHPLAWFDKARCLSAAQRARALCGRVDDPVARAKADMDCGFIRVWWNGWDATTAEVCRNALHTIRATGDEHALAVHLTDYSYVQWAGSEYRDGLASAAC
jgi:predicted ATPase